PGIVAARHVSGDVEYVFAVNATYDAIKGERNSIAPATVMIRLPSDGRPVYDAVLGGQEIGFAGRGPDLSGLFRFGPGQMRVFARTARPIRGVSVTLPTVVRDYTSIRAPLHVDFSAMVVMAVDDNGLLSGSVPLSIKIADPSGTVRYDLLRATDDGVCRMSLPLACNDPSGRWIVSVQELLSNTVGKTEFFLENARDVSAVAGASPRAVSFSDDRDKIFRLVRNSKALVIVTGASDYNDAAAQRLANSLKPWNVKCALIKSAEVKPRDLSEEEARTFVGIDYRASGQIKAGRDNPHDLVGYDVSGPVVLLGNSQDNALIDTVLKHKALPYAPSPDFPGRGHGMMAWQLDIVGQSIESVCLIAYDAEGMSEAVGSFYEAAAGIDPLTPLVFPDMASSEAPPRPTNRVAELRVAWQVPLPDRAVSLKAEKDRVVACSWDGSKTTIDAAGNILEQKPTTSDDLKSTPGLSTDVGQISKEWLLPDRIVKSVVSGGTLDAVAYWGGTLQTFDTNGNLKSQQTVPQDVCGMAWMGSRLVVGLADGRVVALETK
ncbi:MAG: hypothetical protein HY318_08620, partial [Armatimonadetes bacterium]|nr:hypothetical protein [Armatimonadota bacterium]